MADDKTTKTPEQPVTDRVPLNQTRRAPQIETEIVSLRPEREIKTSPGV